MIKKILAFSSAAVVAVSALASAAMAEDNDSVVESEQKWDSVTIELTADLTPQQIRELLQYDNGVDLGAENTWMVRTDDDSKNSYSNIIFSPWVAEETAANGAAWINGSEVPFEFLGGTVNVDLCGIRKDMWLIQNGTSVDPTVNDGTTNNAPSWACDLTDVIGDGKIQVPNASGIVTPMGILGGPAGYQINAKGDIVGVYVGNTIKGSYSQDYQRELAISENAAWITVNNTVSGYVCSPVLANASFGLSATSNLETIDFENSSIKVAFSVEMSKEKWNEIVPSGFGWTWDNWEEDIKNYENAVNKVFGVVSESGTYSDGIYTHVAGGSGIIPVKVTKCEEHSTTDPADLLKYKELSDGTLEVSGIRSRDFTEIAIPETVNGKKVTSIGYRAFYECAGLTGVTIPESVVNIEEGAFDRCTGLENVNYTGNGEQWKEIAIGTNNDPLLNAAIKYSGTVSASEVKVTINGLDKVNVDISEQSVKVSGGGVDVTITINDGIVDISGVANGTYTFTFSAKNCVPRDYKDVTIKDGEVSGLDDVELNLYGDMDGDGEIELTDVMDTYLTLRKPQSKSEYMRAVADANHKDGLNISDVMDVFLHLRGKSSLWN